MASNGNSRGGLLTAGGILSIVVGVFLISGGVLSAVIILDMTYLGGYFSVYIPGPMLQWFMPLLPYISEGLGQYIDVGRIPSGAIIAVCAVVPGIIAVIGGISAIRRKSFGLSLAGAICALPSSVPMGILAVIFVALGKREFDAESKENGI